MKYLKMLGLAAVAAMALTAFAASSASATTLEVGGVVKNEAVEIKAEATEGAVLSRTDGTLANTCTESKVAGKTSVFTGARVTGALSELTFKKCTNEVVVVHKAGQLYVEADPKTHIVKHANGVETVVFTEHTTNGNVFSENAEVTVPTSLGFTVNCKTGEGTKVGTLTGVAAGNATMHINAVLNCGFLLPSASWKGTYTVTAPAGLGVVT